MQHAVQERSCKQTFLVASVSTTAASVRSGTVICTPLCMSQTGSTVVCKPLHQQTYANSNSLGTVICTTLCVSQTGSTVV